MGRRFRVETTSSNYIEVEVDGKGDELRVMVHGEGGSREYRVKIIDFDDEGKHAVIDVNGRRIRVVGLPGGIIIDGIASIVRRITELIPTGISGEVSVSKTARVREKGLITAPISGKIIGVKVKAGDIVEPDTIIALLESMKMITEIKAGVHGVVEEVYVKPGVAVNKGDRIARIRVEEPKEPVKEKKRFRLVRGRKSDKTSS